MKEKEVRSNEKLLEQRVCEMIRCTTLLGRRMLYAGAMDSVLMLAHG